MVPAPDASIAQVNAAIVAKYLARPGDQAATSRQESHAGALIA